MASKQDVIAARLVDKIAIQEFWNNLSTMLAAKANTTDLPTKTSDLTNDGDGTEGAAFALVSAIPTKTSDLTNDSGFITSAALPTKTSDLTNDGDGTEGAAFALVSALPTKVSDLTNDSGFQTESQVSTAITNALADITSVKFEVVTELPATGAAGTFYFMQDASGSGTNTFIEYVWVNNKWESLGPVEADLSGYVSYSDITFMTAAEIDTMMGVSGS